ncbi:extracellular solute-binding protein [Allofournierella massiliensis]|uniref:Arabinogalactan oligomer/maltooligosaccharide transport system substrate-binding protein n=1 Tax=Allofournierella massiliensis TaxID=1650663 RepID=A0A4R1QY31_9FIRM|nr:extracellular solute-binding protein [Fournierella massiliensis]TCL56700.1 arabinogalactan oligomer/maltooligosaccharide transport system substrate-binding protein [Fournierella massiliensis]
MQGKLARAAAALCAGALLLTGCGGTENAQQTKEKVRLMVWSPSEDQSQSSGQWLQTCCERFAELHPEWDITFVYGVADEASAATAVAQDPEASADVFLYANDTLTTMTDAKALAKFGGKYADELKATNSETLLDSLTLDGYVYGVPFTTNTWYMYYDKRVFSEEDVKSLDTMLEKGVVSFPFVNSWYLPAFYFGNGCTLFGDGTQEELGADFGGENAVEVTEYLVDLAANPNFKIDQDGSGLAGLRDGSIHAIFSGSWDAAAVREILGENMGVAALPTYTLNGEEKQVYSYAGSKAIGVNTSTDYMVQAVELAMYLGSAEAQQLHYELRGVIPCNTELNEDPAIAADEVVRAQNDTFDRTSKLQPFVAQMNNCWTPVENMGKAIRNGTVTKENAAEQTKAMNDAMNSDGI